MFAPWICIIWTCSLWRRIKFRCYPRSHVILYRHGYDSVDWYGICYIATVDGDEMNLIIHESRGQVICNSSLLYRKEVFFSFLRKFKWRMVNINLFPYREALYHTKRFFKAPFILCFIFLWSVLYSFLNGLNMVQELLSKSLRIHQTRGVICQCWSTENCCWSR